MEIERRKPGEYSFILEWEYGKPVTGTIERRGSAWWVHSSESQGPNRECASLNDSVAYLNEFRTGAGDLYPEDERDDRSFYFELHDGQYFYGRFHDVSDGKRVIFLVGLGYIRALFDSAFDAEQFVRSGAFLDARYSSSPPESD